MIVRTVLCLLIVCSVHVSARKEDEAFKNNDNPNLVFNENKGLLSLKIAGEKDLEDVVDLSNQLENEESQDCTANGAEFCKVWKKKGNTKLTIGFEKGGWRPITWTSDSKILNEVVEHKNCFPFGGFSWFGGPEQRDQHWPVQKLKFSDQPWVTTNESNQAITDPFWFNSRGIAIVVDRGVPLFVDQNSSIKDNLCLIARVAPPYRERTRVVLSYKVGYHKDARQAFMRSVNDILGKPTGIPDERMIKHPVWSTWALYKVDINETTVRNFAKNIKGYGFKNSQLEIDDDWETCYGEVTFNKEKFPDIKKLVLDLQRDDFRVTLWTHPFVNKKCKLYGELKRKGYFVRNITGTETNWWNGVAGVIDFTNPEAAKDFEDRQWRNLNETGIDGLKFDAGETNWMPKNPILNNIPESPLEDYPSKQVEDYLRTVAKFGSITEFRTAYRTQDLPVFLRMIDKDTRWGYNNGLKTLITTLLQMNMAGYTLALPDMIGGNVYPGDTLTKELFIRWLQANTFMPALQYSRVPWEFDNTTVQIAKHYAELHANYSDTIIELMKNSTKYGTPVNPPIWWNDPTDKVALEIDSEYMLGEDILVAPVLNPGAISRDIYLPEGNWRDMASKNKTVYTGKQWLKRYSASLDTLPYFVRVKSGGNILTVSLQMILASLLSAVFFRRL